MKLYPSQIEDISHIKKVFKTYKGFILANIMGTGKTAVAIDLIKQAYKKKPVLLIVPSYLKLNWLDELEKWAFKGSIQVVDTGKTEIKKADVYVLSYSIACNINIRKQLLKLDTSLLVCDEAHKLKTWNSKRSRYVLGTRQNIKSNYSHKTGRVLLLTGTPVVNNVEDIYNLVAKLSPKLLNNMAKQDFIYKFAKSIHVTPWGLKHSGIKNGDVLYNMIKPIFLARQKIEGLPEKIDHHIRLELKGRVLKNFIKLEEKFLKENGITENNIEELHKKVSFADSHISELRQQVALAKMPIVLNAISDIVEKTYGPIIVYSHHKLVQAKLNEELKNKFKNKQLESINGSVSMSKRNEIIQDFQAGKVDFLSATVGAMKEGVNLYNGQIMVFLELPLIYAEIEQCCARIHRRGQKKQCNIYFYAFNGGIDKHVLKLLKDKEQLGENFKR